MHSAMTPTTCRCDSAQHGADCARATSTVANAPNRKALLIVLAFIAVIAAVYGVFWADQQRAAEHSLGSSSVSANYAVTN